MAVVPLPQASLQTLVDDYLASCRARGLARSTIEQAYSYSLNDVFLPWCQETGLRDLDQLSQRVLDRFTAALLAQGGRRGTLSRHTVHSYIRPVRQFLVWAQREGETASGARPQLPRLPRRVVDVLTREEIAQLEAAATKERDKLMVRLLADTGIRASELCRLTVHDMSRHQRGALLKVRGKGDKERLVPLRPELVRRLERFIARRPTDAQTDHIFTSLRRSSDGEHQPVTRSGLLQLLRGLAYRARITKRIYPHLLRHSLATELLRGGMSPIQVAELLGHSGLRMIESVYSHMTASDTYESVLRVLPSD